MKFTAGETVTIEVDGETLTIKIEDASKGEVVSGKVENFLRSQTYKIGEVYEFERAKIKEQTSPIPESRES